MKDMTKQFKKFRQHNFNTWFSYKAKRLASCFKLKDPVKKNHKHNVVYEIDCPDCDLSYIGESGRRIEERFNPIRPGSRQIDACCVKIYAIFERFTAVAPYFMTFSF